MLKGFLLKLETKYSMVGVHDNQTPIVERLLMPVSKLGLGKLREKVN